MVLYSIFFWLKCPLTPWFLLFLKIHSVQAFHTALKCSPSLFWCMLFYTDDLISLNSFHFTPNPTDPSRVALAPFCDTTTTPPPQRSSPQPTLPPLNVWRAVPPLNLAFTWHCHVLCYDCVILLEYAYQNSEIRTSLILPNKTLCAGHLEKHIKPVTYQARLCSEGAVTWGPKRGAFHLRPRSLSFPAHLLPTG